MRAVSRALKAVERNRLASEDAPEYLLMEGEVVFMGEYVRQNTVYRIQVKVTITGDD